MKSFKTYISESTDLDEMDISVKSIKKSGLANVRKAGKIDKLKSDIAAMRKRLDGDKEKKPLKAAYEEVELDEATTKYVIKHKKTKQVLSTHDNYADAKDEHNGLGSDKVNHGIYKQAKKDSALANRNTYREEVELDEDTINSFTADYINENDITLEELENMTEEELNELIGAAIGGAFKVGAKAAVGAARLAGKAAVGSARLAKKAAVNKQGNVRGTQAAKNDASRAQVEKLRQKRKEVVQKRLQQRKANQLKSSIEREKNKLAASKAKANK